MARVPTDSTKMDGLNPAPQGAAHLTNGQILAGGSDNKNDRMVCGRRNNYTINRAGNGQGTYRVGEKVAVDPPQLGVMGLEPLGGPKRLRRTKVTEVQGRGGQGG